MGKKTRTERWCDRCGHKFGRIEYMTCHQIRSKTYIPGMGWIYSDGKDLCRYCTDDFDRFINAYSIPPLDKERGLDGTE